MKPANLKSSTTRRKRRSFANISRRTDPVPMVLAAITLTERRIASVLRMLRIWFEPVSLWIRPIICVVLVSSLSALDHVHTGLAASSSMIQTFKETKIAILPGSSIARSSKKRSQKSSPIVSTTQKSMPFTKRTLSSTHSSGRNVVLTLNMPLQVRIPRNGWIPTTSYAMPECRSSRVPIGSNHTRCLRHKRLPSSCPCIGNRASRQLAMHTISISISPTCLLIASMASHA
mmetsp:Transcript_19704/g.41263  ORF Transcript_19704/g.41263 Transcript_19704/m.41263 type:complete len:231 (+) Transcript_19704:767-1459(+)